MNKYLTIIFIVTAILILFSCKKQEDKKPFGAENIDYEQVEKINSNGPVFESSEQVNALPIADKVEIVENGPQKTDDSGKVEPTADIDLEPDFGGIPIVKKAK